jgi:uncharacterized protein (DUF3820 family)
VDEQRGLRDWREDVVGALALIGRWRMPFGKYGPRHYPPNGVPLYDLPEEYLIWFLHHGFPQGRLGELLKMVYEIRMAGAEEIFEPLRRAAGGRRPPRSKKQLPRL